MKFPVVVSCGYPSYEEAGIAWEDLEYRAYNVVKAVKGSPFNGYAMFGNVRVDNTPAGRANARRLVANDAVTKLDDLGVTGPLVAVPASSHVDFEGSFAGAVLAQEIAERGNGRIARPVLKFREQLPKAADGGDRSPQGIADNLELHPDVDFDNCILIDDVTTTGGHLKGAARFLEGHGIAVRAAYCVAQTVWARPPHLFRIDAFELDSQPQWYEL
jgi:hypothetical protein